MIQQKKDFCFCTLALRPKYRLLAQNLARNLEQYASGIVLVVGTDEPQEFRDIPNVVAFKHRQKGIFHCYNDRRFVVEKALSMFPVAIHIDSDTKILANVPEQIEFSPGISGCHENLIKHINRYRKKDRGLIEKVAQKLDIPWESADWIGESLYIVSRDSGKEKEFIKVWGTLANYLELQGIHSGDGNLMGLAAAKVGWTVNSDSWKKLQIITEHLDASHEQKKTSAAFWEPWKRRLGYHYRLNMARLKALKDFDFYYK